MIVHHSVLLDGVRCTVKLRASNVVITVEVYLRVRALCIMGFNFDVPLHLEPQGWFQDQWFHRSASLIDVETRIWAPELDILSHMYHIL